MNGVTASDMGGYPIIRIFHGDLVGKGKWVTV